MSDSAGAAPHHKVLDTLAGGGDLGARMRATEWAATPLGPVEAWPQSLKTAVRIMLTSRQPIWLGWGPTLIKLYNDPYRAILGGKHPAALGQPAAVVWHEIWDAIEPMLATALGGSEGTYVESQLLIMERNGYPEETYYTFSYSPIPADHGGVGGIICANTDDTQRVISERQLALLRELAACTAEARTLADVCRLAVTGLTTNQRDLPFVALYLVDTATQELVLYETSGIARDHPALPERLALTSDQPWPLATLHATGQTQLVADLRFSPAALPSGAWDRPPHQAAVIPIASPGRTDQAGVLLVGLNPFRRFDPGYRGFLELVAGQLASSLANAQAYETERQRAEALAELDRAKTAFFSNISHEFRTPLTLMLGPAEDALADPETSPANRERIAIIQRNAVRLLKLVNTLLDFSRLEAGRLAASFTPTDLPTFTADLAGVFRAAIERVGVRLEIDCPPQPEPAFVDRALWEQIVFNLLSNAFKFTFAGTILVQLRLQDDQFVLTVSDTGTGIAAADLPRLFERFYRVTGAAGRTFEGSGIGLALVQELVQLHGGNVAVASELGQGTRFTVTIPRGAAHLPAEQVSLTAEPTGVVQPAAFLSEAENWLPQAPAQPIPVPAPVPAEPVAADQFAARPLILIADDNRDMRDYLRRLLSAIYTVVVAEDGAAALAAIEQQLPDLIVSDVMMPQLDGFSLIQRLRANPRTREIPIVLLSARAGEEARVEGMQTGADDYLIKPFSARELLARVATHLRLTQLRQASTARLRLFTELTGNFSAAQSLSEVRRLLLHDVTRALGARGGGLRLLTDQGLVLDDYDLGSRTPQENLERSAFVPLGANHPAAEVARTGAALFITDAQTSIERYPTSATVLAQQQLEASAHLPLRRGDELFGVFSLGFATPQRWDEEARRFAQALVDRAAVAYERARLFEELSISQASLALALQAGQAGTFEWDIQNDVNRWSPELESLYGLPPGAFGKTYQAWASRVEAEDLVVIERELRATLEARQLEYVYEFRAVMPDLTRRWLGGRARFEYAATGLPLRMRGINIDIQERKQREINAQFLLDLDTQINRLDDPAAIESAVVTQLGTYLNLTRCYFGHIDGGQLTIREAWQRSGPPLTGTYPLEDFFVSMMLPRTGTAHATVVEDIATDPRTADRSAWYQARGVGAFLSMPVLLQGVWVGSLNVVSAARRAWLPETLQLLRDTVARTWPLLEQARVQTALRSSEAQLQTLYAQEQAARAEAEIASRLKDEFLATVSHELRTPLTALLGYLHMLQSRKRDEEYIARTVEKLLESAKAQAQLIDDLLDVSRIVNGQLRLQPTPLDLSAVIEAAIDTVHPALNAKLLELIVNLDPAATAVIGDPNRLQQVIWNLLSNAIKFSQFGATVEVRLERAEQYAQLSVSDTGQGISADFLPHVFERFRQADGTSTRGHGGLGLGLAIVRHLVELHGGTIAAASPGRGQGATFTVWLPLASRAPIAA